MLNFLFASIAYQSTTSTPEPKVEKLQQIEEKRLKNFFNGQVFSGHYKMRNSEAPELIQSYLVDISKVGVRYIHAFNGQIHSVTSKTSKFTWEAFMEDKTYRYSEDKPEFPFKKIEPVPVPDGQLYTIEFGDYGIRFAVANEVKTEEIPRPEGNYSKWIWYKTEFKSKVADVKGVLIQSIDPENYILQSFSIEMSFEGKTSTIYGDLVKASYGGQVIPDAYDITDVIKNQFRKIPPSEIKGNN